MKQLNWYQIFGNAHIIPDGKTVTPTDDIQTLLHCANIWDKSYTTIGEVIADDDTLFLTLIDNNAIDYLVRSTTFASSIVASESAMQYIGASDYASETLLSDSTWLTAIDGSAYKDYVINASVPTMTSNTAPYGTAFAYGELSGYEAYKAFDNNDTTLWQGRPGALVGTIGYCFVNPVKVAQVKYRDKYGSKQVTLSHSDNGTDYTVASESATITSGETNYYFSPSSLSSHRYWRVNITATESSYFYVETLQFSGRQNAGVQTWLKAGGITNKKYTTVSEVLSDLTTLATLMASTDAIDYLVTAKGWATEICSDSNAMADIGMNNYAANTLLADETWAEAIAESAYYTSVLNDSVPTMTSNTQPIGVCSSSSNFSGRAAYEAFDKNAATFWGSAYGGTNSWLQYEFAHKVRAVKVVLANMSTGEYGAKKLKIQASNDNFVTIGYESEVFTNTNTTATPQYYNISNNTNEFFSYRVICVETAMPNYWNVGELNFYGRKDI